MLRSAKTYDEAWRTFRWTIPALYNIGVDAVDRHVAAGNGDRLALIHERENGAVERYSFQDVARQSSRLANLLLAQGLKARRPCRHIAAATAGDRDRTYRRLQVRHGRRAVVHPVRPRRSRVSVG